MAMLTQRLMSAGVLTYECHSCGITEWRSNPLKLLLARDETQWTLLCPNCQAQEYGTQDEVATMLPDTIG